MSNTASKILIPIGFSDQSMVALDQGINLARIKNSEVVLLSVIEERHAMLELFIGKDDELEILKEKVLDKLGKPPYKKE